MSEESRNQAAPENGAPAAEPVRKQKGRKKRKWVRRLILTLVLLCALGLWGWNTASKLQADYTVTYDPYVATTGSISNSLSFTGTMQLVNSATYTAPADTKVREVYVAVGQRVKDGDRLMRLANGTTVEAEFDGTVTAVEAEAGAAVAKGAALFQLIPLDELLVETSVYADDLKNIRVGDPVTVELESDESKVYEGVIRFISALPTEGEEEVTYRVLVDFAPDEEAALGMSVIVTTAETAGTALAEGNETAGTAPAEGTEE